MIEGFREALSLLGRGDPVTYHAVAVSLGCTLTAVALAGVTAIPVGAWLGFYHPRVRWPVIILRLGMSVPTVILGLFVFLLFTRRGLLGDLDLLYTRSAIVVGEFLLAFPLLGTLAHGMATSLSPVVIETSLTLGAGRVRAMLRALGECRGAIVAACLAGFGRCLTELGIAYTVGGNVAGDTRTLPGAVQLELTRGDFAAALAPGIILVALAFCVTLLAQWIAGESKR